jgi:hypothetical protein
MKALNENTTPDPVALVAKAREESKRRDEPVKPAKFHAATREGMKRLLTPVTPELHKRLKMLAVKQDTTLEALGRVALESYLSQHDSK